MRFKSIYIQKQKQLKLKTIHAIVKQMSETSDISKEKTVAISQTQETSDSTKVKSAVIDTITAMDRKT